MAYLVLTRKLLQEVKIGDDITIKIVGVSGGQVRIGIQAPVNLDITRPDKHDAPGRIAPPMAGDATGS